MDRNYRPLCPGTRNRIYSYRLMCLLSRPAKLQLRCGAAAKEIRICPRRLTTSSSAADPRAPYLPIDCPRAAATAFCCAKPVRTRQMGACPKPSSTAVRLCVARPTVPVEQAAGYHRGYPPQRRLSATPARATLRTGTCSGRRLVDKWSTRQSRLPCGLRRVGGTRRHRLALGDGAAVLPEGRAGHRLRRAAAWFRRVYPGPPCVP